jgi:hypothetical protein
MSKPIAKFEAEETKERKPPTMSRSRGQLAASYAPGAFFTFEGGLGSCLALPDYRAAEKSPNITNTVRDQIVLRLDDIVKSWFGMAFNCRQGDTSVPPVRAGLCVDQSLLNATYDGVQPVNLARFVFVSPEVMGYVPAPLTFVCNHCGTYRYFGSIEDFHANAATALNVKCSNHAGNCHWRQLDVIFVHWSGHWEPVRPGGWSWDSNTKELREPFDRCRNCQQNDFRLETRHSETAIGGWYFVCKSCGQPDVGGWRKNDPDTIRVVGEDFVKFPAVARMEAISYRASAAYYAQADQFIIFDDKQQSLLNKLDQSQSAELKNFLAQRFGFGKSRPTDAEIEIILNQTPEGAESLADIKLKKKLLATNADNSVLAEMLKKDIAKIEKSWFEGPNAQIKEKTLLPAGIALAVDSRKSDYDARYDPFRLVVEHEALKQNHLDAPKQAMRSPFVRFDRLDEDLAPKDKPKKEKQEHDTRVALDSLGIDTMGLIRNFKLCRFTFGYTRVSATPWTERHNKRMPVRLNLFPRVSTDQGDKRHPIYVITQENEAYYVRLKDELVYAWLRQLDLSDAFDWTKTSSTPLGAKILERAQPMWRFLSNVQPEQPPLTYFYTYTLLHTFSHLMMRGISELSGLDAGSLGEYIFPADFAFVVYRTGTTLDLGNLSSLWRNYNQHFLRHLTEPATLRCNSGSLCAERGGACPDCILIPETSCIAVNQLLSRSVLRGGPRTREDALKTPIPGYLDIVANASKEADEPK